VRVQVAANQVKLAFGDIELISKAGRRQVSRLPPRRAGRQHQGVRDRPRRSDARAAARRDLTTDKFKGVRMVLAPGVLKISSTNADQEDAQEELEIDYAGEGLDIGFNVNYLLDALSNLKGELVKFSLGDALGSALVTMPDSDKFKYVVMPMRI
jgi:DNA polymerase III subunit beta